jgi:hypothetical protein
MSIRAVIVGTVLLVLLREASADTVVIGTPGQIGAALFGAQVGSALGAGVDFARVKAQVNAQIGAARRRFFAEYPKGRDFAQAEKEFANLLWEKDLYYMSMRLSTGSMPSTLGKLDAVTGGPLDNGIPSEAGAFFGRWVSGIRNHLGAKSRAPLARFPSQSELLAALDANKDAYAQYKKARDEAEFEAQCRARPGPYCALPGGGYSHGGATERAARIADYYLAHYARSLPGGEAVKTKLRDAIIKYESLAYTTQDCIRQVGKSFENDPRHDQNLAALRHAIAKYESVKFMSQEDICIRAVDEMQRAEAAQNRVPHGPLPKEFWDSDFRTWKFNERYGPLTSDQVRELSEAARGTVKDFRVTVINYYTGNPKAQAAQVPRYHRVRQHILESASGVQSAARAPANITVPEKHEGSKPASPPSIPAKPTAVPADPDTGRSLYFRGLEAFSAGDYQRARGFYEQACQAGKRHGL